MRKTKTLAWGLLTVGIAWLLIAALPVAGAARARLLAAARRMATARAASASRRTYTVKATAYEAVVGQTDSKPFVTADNSRIPRGYGSHTRWLALSRDLLQPWGGPFEFGDKVRVQGMSPALDGVYTVHDTMNRRYRHCLDVLVHPREHMSISCANVKIQRVSALQRRSSTSRLVVARRASKKPARVLKQIKLAHRQTSPRRAMAHHSPAPRSRSRAKHLAAASRPATRRAKQPAQPTRRAPLAHQKRRVAKKPLAALPKRQKKRVAVRAHHRPTA